MVAEGDGNSVASFGIFMSRTTRSRYTITLYSSIVLYTP